MLRDARPRIKSRLGATPVAPSGPQIERPKPPTTKSVSPWLVIGAAFAAGYLLAKVVDWRGHAHPRF